MNNLSRPTDQRRNFIFHSVLTYTIFSQNLAVCVWQEFIFLFGAVTIQGWLDSEGGICRYAAWTVSIAANLYAIILCMSIHCI